MKTKGYNPKSESWRTKVANVDDKGRVEIAVNAFNNEDFDGDISVPGSFTKTLQENFNRVKWFLNHDRKILLGVPLSGEETPEYLKMTAQFNMNKQISKDTYEDYKLYADNGKTLEHSVGVDAIKRDSSNPKRVLEWKLWEFSTITSWGANENTPLLSLKSLNGETPENILEHIDFLTKAVKQGYSQERLEKIEKTMSILEKMVKKSIDSGEFMVVCPYCGEAFDYNQENEITYEQQVLSLASDYARWITEDIVRQEMNKLRPEIQAEVQAIISAHKSMNEPSNTKSIENFSNYVRCPKCWTRVYKTNSLEPVSSTQEDDEEDKSCGKRPKTEKEAGSSTLFGLKSLPNIKIGES